MTLREPKMTVGLVGIDVDHPREVPLGLLPFSQAKQHPAGQQMKTYLMRIGLLRVRQMLERVLGPPLGVTDRRHEAVHRVPAHHKKAPRRRVTGALVWREGIATLDGAARCDFG